MIYNGIMTHNTLNSVDWNEEIYYKKDNFLILFTFKLIYFRFLSANNYIFLSNLY